MPDLAVESLRAQLRERGYLSRGIERWFALDPWISRAFWTELATVAAKAATLIALFAALPNTAVMLARNHPLSTLETIELYLLYGAAWWATLFCGVIIVALLLKLRPELAIDTPRGLLAISIATAAVFATPLVFWWYLFETPPGSIELLAGGTLAVLSFLVTAIVVSAALLSFSIHELQRIPVIHQRRRTFPLATGAAILALLLLVPAWGTKERQVVAPLQVVTTPTPNRLALIAVDGLTYDIFESRPDLIGHFSSVNPARSIDAPSTTERWASLGTGVARSLHGVRAVAGIRLAAGRHLIQSVSGFDFVLSRFAPAAGIARAQALPPTVRRRDYVWEIFAARGLPSVSVNWWTTPSIRNGALTSVGQETIFSAAHGDPLRIDQSAARRVLSENGSAFVTVYLPALDVALNRATLDPATRLSVSLRALDGVSALTAALRARGYHVLVAGMPGDGQRGQAVIASTLKLRPAASAFDVAPTLCELMGFPPSKEMPGRALAGAESLPRIASYGNRNASDKPVKLSNEYYESLRSLGYIR